MDSPKSKREKKPDSSRDKGRENITADDLERVREDFRAGREVVKAPPTRFYLNLTDCCNLRCRHCITRAPRHTLEKTGRQMPQEVIKALRPHLRHAAYLGFPHAGEPTLAPGLFPVLEALQQERQGEPTVVHLLTNGQRLSEEFFLRLVKGGVNSWSFSVDGMTPATHDQLRQGSNIERLLSTLRSVSSLRQQQAPKVRMGIAWTVTQNNLHEIDELLRFAAETGLDWVKLEEIFPLDEESAQLAQIDPVLLQQTLDRARERAASLSLPLLLHLDEVPVFKCCLQEDPVMRAFSLGDDLVNRMEIHPCRLPYELVCIEPNGEVKPLSFDHPPAGNLLQTDLRILWNHPGFQQARRLSLFRRRCPSLEGPVCPPDRGPESW